MDPKPPERIILDESGSERDRKSLDEKSESKDHESSSDKGHYEHVDKKSDSVGDKHDDKREGAEKVTLKSKAKELVPPVKSGEPTIVYAVKADEKERAEGFQTSHRIPNIDEGERKFETSHHIPAHIETERTKLIENAKKNGEKQVK